MHCVEGILWAGGVASWRYTRPGCLSVTWPAMLVPTGDNPLLLLPLPQLLGYPSFRSESSPCGCCTLGGRADHLPSSCCSSTARGLGSHCSNMRGGVKLTPIILCDYCLPSSIISFRENLVLRAALVSLGADFSCSTVSTAPAARGTRC